GAEFREACRGGQAIHDHREGSRKTDCAGKKAEAAAVGFSKPPLGLRLPHLANAARRREARRCYVLRVAVRPLSTGSEETLARTSRPSERDLVRLGVAFGRPGFATVRCARFRLCGFSHATRRCEDSGLFPRLAPLWKQARRAPCRFAGRR